jgi:hypothetical protein
MPIAGSDIFIHVRVLLGVVLGLALSRMLAGLTTFVQHPGRKPLDSAHLIWIATIIVMAVHFWWWEFALIRIQPWHFELFAFVLAYAFLFCLLAAMLVPNDIAGYESYGDYFISRRRWFFGLLALTIPVDLIDTFAKGPSYLASLGMEYPFRLIGLGLLCVICVWTKDRRIHTALAAIYLLYYLSWILRWYRILE